MTGQIQTTGSRTRTSYSVTVTASDPCGASASIDVTITVNFAPVFNRSSYHFVEKSSAPIGKSVGSVTASDRNGDAISYSLTGSHPFQINGSTGAITVNGPLSVRTYNLSAIASDSTLADTADVAIEVTNSKPVCDSIPPQRVEVGQKVTVVLSCRDSDDHSLTYGGEFSSNTRVATVELSGRRLTITGVARGETTVGATADDGHGGTAEASGPVTVPNRAPEPVGTIPEDTVEVGQSGRVSVSEYFRDPDGDNLTYTASSNTSKVRVDVTGAKVKYYGEAVGSATVTVTATDTGNLSVTQMFSVTVERDNGPPVVENPIGDIELYVGEGPTEAEIGISNVFSDPDNDLLGYSFTTSDPGVATVRLVGTTLTVTAVGKGMTTITVTAKDPGELSATDEFNVDVPNRKPVVENPIGDIELYVGEGPNLQRIDISSVFRDPDNDPLGYSVATSDAGVATVRLVGTTLTVTAVGKGRATVTVTANDGMGGETSDAFRVRVPNRRPEGDGTISDDTIEVDERGTVDVSGYFSDPDGDGLTYSARSSDGSVSAGVRTNSSRVWYEGEAVGSATVTVTASDGELSATQSFTVTVEAVVDPCVIDVRAAGLSVREDAVPGRTEVGRVRVTSDSCGALTYGLSGTGSSRFSVAAASGNSDDAKITVASGLDHETRAFVLHCG